MRTPWGISENIETVSCGLLFADTAGHGGINVRLDKNTFTFKKPLCKTGVLPSPGPATKNNPAQETESRAEI